MLEKDKNCIEFSMHSMMATHKPHQEDTEISITGMAPGKSLLWAKIPFDIPCDVVVVSKRYFERVQADNEHYRELAKQLEHNYELLLTMAGFNTLEELTDYIHDAGKNSIGNYKTLKEIADDAEEGYGWRQKYETEHYRELAKKWEDNYKDLLDKTGFYNLADLMWYLPKDKTLKEFIDEFEKDYISERNKVSELEADKNQQVNSWKIAAECNTPKELRLKMKDYNYICKLKGDYDTLSKLVGFSSVEEIQDYLTNEAECDTLHEAIASLEYNVKFARDERRNLSKKLDECEKDYISERDKAEALQTENEQLKKKLEEFSPDLPGYREFFTALYPEADVEKMVWATKHIFGCRSQQDVLQSDLEYYRAMSSVQAKSIHSWKEATGCVTPDQVKSRIEGLENAIRLTNKNMLSELDSEINEWQKATGCDTPEQAKERIKALNERIDESEADYNHLLCTTGFESEGEIEDALDKCDHSTLRKALVDYEFDYNTLLKFTGYKSEHDIRVLLNNSEQFVYKNMRELIYSLKRKAKFTETNWQQATGCDTPGRAEEKLEFYKERLSKAVQAASCAAKHLENITC